MLIFVYEFLSANDDPQNMSQSLIGEGQAMLAALLDDFSRVAGVQTVTLLSHELARDSTMAGDIVCRHGCEESVFKDIANNADFTIVIAPEFQSLLKTRAQWVLQAGGRLLGPYPEAIQLTANKKRLGQFWQAHGVPTPAFLHVDDNRFPAIIKLCHGAGSVATFRVSDRITQQLKLAQARDSFPDDDILIQEFASGQPASVAYLVGPERTVALRPASQLISPHDCLHYLGGSIPLPDMLAMRAIRLARRALAPIPGLLGYVGVDMILGSDPDGAEDVVLEINPRLTTSYVGLRALAQCNLAEAMLAVAMGQPCPPIQWKPGRVQFSAAGEVESC